MLANRGTVAWASDEAQRNFCGAHVMSFQAPDTWYYAQRDGLLEIAYNEINDLIKLKISILKKYMYQVVQLVVI